MPLFRLVDSFLSEYHFRTLRTFLEGKPHSARNYVGLGERYYYTPKKSEIAHFLDEIARIAAIVVGVNKAKRFKPIHFDSVKMPEGSFLTWHTDHKEKRVLAFTYYLHQKWDYWWGGQTCILTDGCPPRTTFGEYEAALVEPIPNRLLVMPVSPNSFHCVLPVSRNHVRHSLTGWLAEK